MCHRHLRVCGIGSWYVMLVCSLGAEESQTHRFGSVFVRIYLRASYPCMHAVCVCNLNMWPLHAVVLMSVCVNHGLLQGRDTACHLVTARARLLSEKIAVGEETRCHGLANIYSLRYRSDADSQRRTEGRAFLLNFLLILHFNHLKRLTFCAMCQERGIIKVYLEWRSIKMIAGNLAASR